MHIPTFHQMSTALSLSSALQQGLGDNPFSSKPSNVLLPELPGGTPFSLCPESRSTDLFKITSIELTKQPVYIDDALTVHMYGSFQETWSSKAAVNVTVDCGSHCEMYGNPPGERPGSSFSLPFCNASGIEQPSGGEKRNQTCPPVEGYALISSPIYVFSMFIGVPGWYNFTFDAKTADGERIYCLTTEVCLRYEDPEKNKHYPKGPWSHCQWPR